jgi:hypothetical protein
VKRAKKRGRIKISVLTNAAYYSFYNVLVKKNKKFFQLLVINPLIELIENRKFNTLEEAQHYFTNNFIMMKAAVINHEKPIWTQLYSVKASWVYSILDQCVDKSNKCPLQINCNLKPNLNVSLSR